MFHAYQPQHQTLKLRTINFVRTRPYTTALLSIALLGFIFQFGAFFVSDSSKNINQSDIQQFKKEQSLNANIFDNGAMIQPENELSPEKIESRMNGNNDAEEIEGHFARKSAFMIITISSKPTNWNRRKEQRETFISRFPSDIVEYRFITEKTGLSEEDLARIEVEANTYDDIIFLDLSAGYTNFAARGILSLQWAVENFDFKYYIRIDDDSFICWDRFYEELLQRPREKFFWAKYWCWSEFAVPDENFMLFSSDIAKFVVQGMKTGLLKFNPDSTFAVNFQVWSIFLDLTIFDDRPRMDTQQGLLTNYVHQQVTSRYTDEYSLFCSKHWYAHHVHEGVMYELEKGADIHGHEVPEITSPSKACDMKLSLNTAKHHTPGWPAPAPPLPICHCHYE